MASITFNYNLANPDDVGVELDIAEDETLSAATIIEILATGVDGVVVTCWEDNDDREQAALGVAKLLLIANDERKGHDDE